MPGAFTPTCSSNHVPGYLAKQAELKAKGVEEVIVCSVTYWRLAGRKGVCVYIYICDDYIGVSWRIL